MSKIVLEKKAVFRTEDGGQALIADIDSPEEPQVFIRLQSWDETGYHNQARQFAGRKVRVTVEVLE